MGDVRFYVPKGETVPTVLKMYVEDARLRVVMDGIEGMIENGTLDIDLDDVDMFLIFHGGKRISFAEFMKRIVKDNDDD